MVCKQVGFIGLGMMGSGMAKNLIRNGYPVRVFDIDQAQVEKVVSAGGVGATSLEELAAECDVICSSLPGPSTVRDVYLGSGAVLVAAKPETVIIDLSTVDPETTRVVATEAEKRQIRYLDCPVSGGPKEAETGSLTLIVGGDKEVFEACKPILCCLGSTVHYAGPSGSGNVVKLVNNIMSMGNILVAAEAMVLGVKAGVSGRTLFNIIRTSGGRSHHFEKRFPNVLQRDFRPGFTVDLARKDVGLALEMAKKLGVPSLVTSFIFEFYEIMAALGQGKDDCVAVVNLFEKWAGAEIKE